MCRLAPAESLLEHVGNCPPRRSFIVGAGRQLRPVEHGRRARLFSNTT
jgi:hypothetical protein